MIVIAHNIRSLHNVGSIFRSCDAFGVEKLYLTGITGVPPRREIAKVALGSEHRVAWEQADNALELVMRLRGQGWTVVALDNVHDAKPLHTFYPAGQIVLVLGSEVEGIDSILKDQCDVILEIPMPGRKQSLNVSVAAGIALFALMRPAR